MQVNAKQADKRINIYDKNKMKVGNSENMYTQHIYIFFEQLKLRLDTLKISQVQ